MPPGRAPQRRALGLARVASAAASWLVLAAPAAATAPQAPAPPPVADYTLAAVLDPASHTLRATGRVVWRNTTRQPVTALRMHLYWNAWRDTRSTWMRERRLARGPSAAAWPDADRSAIDLTALGASAPDRPLTDLLRQARFVAPDDGNPGDRTLLEVPLDSPVAPGQSIELALAWSAQVPRTVARTGRAGHYYLVAHWFPKIGVLADDGWAARQFHAATEFFADFGRYDVSLTVPAGWAVGATGRLESATDGEPGTRVHRFVAENVHDFAWTTSPDFVERTARFEPPGGPPVTFRLLLQPEHVDQLDRHVDAARAALEGFGAWFGAYPYAGLTIVDPVAIVHRATQGESTGGMEYPMLVTAGTRWALPWRSAQPEEVIVHEVGHQFWQGVVATNEVDHAWLDEGLTTYVTARLIDERWPGRFVAVERYFGGIAAWSYEDARWSRAIDGNRLHGYRLAARAGRLSTPSWQLDPLTAGLVSYNKAALALATLERLVGWPAMQRILSTYLARGRFRHPTPDEFLGVIREVAGGGLDEVVETMFRSSATFDYAVIDVVERTVVVRRQSDGVFPVTIRATAADGTVVDHAWDGRDEWHRWVVPGTSPIARVVVDPDRLLLFDLNYTNNSWMARPEAGRASTRWALRWLTWVQELLLTYAVFA